MHIENIFRGNKQYTNKQLKTCQARQNKSEPKTNLLVGDSGDFEVMSSSAADCLSPQRANCGDWGGTVDNSRRVNEIEVGTLLCFKGKFITSQDLWTQFKRVSGVSVRCLS